MHKKIVYRRELVNLRMRNDRNLESNFAKNKIEETFSFKLNIGSKGKIGRIKIQPKKYRIF